MNKDSNSSESDSDNDSNCDSSNYDSQQPLTEQLNDPDFWEPACRKLVKFYNLAIIPELVVPRYSNGQQIRKPFLPGKKFTAPHLAHCAILHHTLSCDCLV